MDRVANPNLAPFGNFTGDYNSTLVPTTTYYYTANGEVVPGSNTNVQQFSEFTQPVRNLMGTPIDVRTQSDVWDVYPENTAEASPILDAALNFVAPVIDFFQGVVESFTGKAVIKKKIVVPPKQRKH